MSVSVIGGSTSSATFEGGVQTYAFNKTKDVMAVPSTKLPAGSYYVAASANGSISIRSYDSSNVIGSTIVEFAVTGTRTGVVATLPASLGGIYISGSYTGPISFQVLPTANSVAVSQTVSLQGTLVDYGMPSWGPVLGKDTLMWTQDATTKKVMVTNVVTGVMVTSNIALLDGNGVNSTVNSIASNGTRLVATSGAASASNGKIYYSDDNGATWIASSNTYTNTQSDGATVRYVNGYFIITPGTNSYSTYFYSTDGAAWSSALLPSTSYSPWLFEYFSPVGWVLYALNNSAAYYTASSITTGSFTTRTFPSGGSYSPTLMLSFAGLLILSVNGVSNSEWWKSSDGINWLTMSTTFRSLASGISPNVRIPNYAVVGGTLYWGGRDQNSSLGVNTLSSSLTFTSYRVINGTYLGESVFPFNGGVASNAQYSSIGNPYSWQNIQVTGSQYSMISISQGYAPNINSVGFAGKYFYSSIFGYWYLLCYDSNSTVSRIYKASVAGTAGITSSWINVANISLASSYTPYLCDTGSSIALIYSGTSTFYRSTDGSSFSNISTSPTGTFNGNIAYKNGTLVAGLSQAATVAWSTNDGTNWVSTSATSTTSGNTEVWIPYSYSGGFTAISNSTAYLSRSTDGTSWTAVGTSTGYPNTTKIFNDRLIYQNTSSPYNGFKTLPGVFSGASYVFATSPWSPPSTDNQWTLTQCGTTFIYYGYQSSTNVYYTSQDLITWTVRYLNYGGNSNVSRKWTITGSDTHLIAVYYSAPTGATNGENVIEVNRINNTVTLS